MEKKKVKEIEKRKIWERKVKRDLWRLFDNLCFDGILCIVFMLLGRCYEIRLKIYLKEMGKKKKRKKKMKINYEKWNEKREEKKKEKKGKQMRKEMKD